jgi:ATP-dependent Lhr-like helicase
VQGRIRHQPLDHVSPLSIPILLEIGAEAVAGRAREDLLREAASELIEEAQQEEPVCSS